MSALLRSSDQFSDRVPSELSVVVFICNCVSLPSSIPSKFKFIPCADVIFMANRLRRRLIAIANTLLL